MTNRLRELIVALVAVNAAAESPVSKVKSAQELSDRLPALVKATDSKEEKEKCMAELVAIENDLVGQDPDRFAGAFFSKVQQMTPDSLGRFEGSALNAYAVFAKKSVLTPSDEAAMGEIAVFGKKAMSAKLAELFVRDFRRVKPYRFGKSLAPYGGWRIADESDWKGTQGRLVSGSVASDQPEILEKWIEEAAKADGDERMVILWALGYSFLPRSAEYLLGELKTSISDRERELIECALSHQVERMKMYESVFARYSGIPYGTLSVDQVAQLSARLREWRPKLEKLLSDAAVKRHDVTAMLMYAE